MKLVGRIDRARSFEQIEWRLARVARGLDHDVDVAREHLGCEVGEERNVARGVVEHRAPVGAGGERRAQLQAQGKKVVFTNGCFDLLHGGHIKFLEESRRLGDVLVVAVDSDASVRQVKGEGRPVIGEDQRVRILAALAAVDYVTVFTSHQLPELLASLRPDLLTKGSNYPAEQVAGAEIALGRTLLGRHALAKEQLWPSVGRLQLPNPIAMFDWPLHTHTSPTRTFVN